MIAYNEALLYLINFYPSDARATSEYMGMAAQK